MTAGRSDFSFQPRQGEVRGQREKWPWPPTDKYARLLWPLFSLNHFFFHFCLVFIPTCIIGSKMYCIADSFIGHQVKDDYSISWTYMYATWSLHILLNSNICTSPIHCVCIALLGYNVCVCFTFLKKLKLVFKLVCVSTGFMKAEICIRDIDKLIFLYSRFQHVFFFLFFLQKLILV